MPNLFYNRQLVKLLTFITLLQNIAIILIIDSDYS